MKKSFLKFLSNQYNFKIFLPFLILGVLLISCALEYAQVKSKFENKINFWQMEINSALLSNDWVTAVKYLKSSVEPALHAAELVVNNRVVFSTKSNFDSKQCVVVWTTPIKQYESELGLIKSCPNFYKIIFSSLVSPFFVAVTLLSIVLIALSSSITLLKYKNGVLGIFDLLSKAHDEKDGSILSVNKDQLSAGDAIVNRTIGLMQSLFQERLNRESIESRAKAARKISMLAASFAHDIRSPLSALRIATQSDLNKPGVKELVELSANRINSISDQLLKDAKGSIEEDQDVIISRELERLHLKSDVVVPVVEEKRMEFRSKPGVVLSVKSSISDYDFINGDKVQLQRMLSNLINNSVESFGSQPGSVLISLSSTNDQIEISVCDNGPGIPQEILNKIGTFGYSYGKANSQSGNGIGVYFAKKVVSECSGTFEISSTVESGTIIKIQFPRLAGELIRPYFGNKADGQHS